MMSEVIVKLIILYAEHVKVSFDAIARCMHMLDREAGHARS